MIPSSSFELLTGSNRKALVDWSKVMSEKRAASLGEPIIEVVSFLNPSFD
jgi:hypothetical protein